MAQLQYDSVSWFEIFIVSVLILYLLFLFTKIRSTLSQELKTHKLIKVQLLLYNIRGEILTSSPSQRRPTAPQAAGNASLAVSAGSLCDWEKQAVRMFVRWKPGDN